MHWRPPAGTQFDDLRLVTLVVGHGLIETGDDLPAFRCPDQRIGFLTGAAKRLFNGIDRRYRRLLLCLRIGYQQAQGGRADAQEFLVQLTELNDGGKPVFIDLLRLALNGRHLLKRETAEQKDQQRHDTEADARPKRDAELSKHGYIPPEVKAASCHGYRQEPAKLYDER